jgi:hypothetical protein
MGKSTINGIFHEKPWGNTLKKHDDLPGKPLGRVTSIWKNMLMDR